mmetsp:Transcript_5984/g.14520  ORF Transcript_5984/g.14520 Transcript_5984/m.14520 type:complete len:95 (-) Transcript_5984:2355-2639(-)|eukprot:CAMPEP_0113890062 /NCGR_PEP_ID=MMETSP0780_2-20120614/13898_1 /TAXON_ID=652834 /ORGANISM="Palpitomonas bilix" /LENGTH=94 /DNA_ID=CAMNT_0000879339 /DNA_START=199 /DNA_END=483 /DNA_ORIENTATION=- /assembly_acc=CAM_ASM_000599
MQLQEELLRTQRVAKRYQAVKDGKYKPAAKEGDVAAEIQKAAEKEQVIRNIVEAIKAAHPEAETALDAVSNLLVPLPQKKAVGDEQGEGEGATA